MTRECKALALAAGAMLAAMGGAWALGHTLQAATHANSHEQPAVAETWLITPPPPDPAMAASGQKLFLNSCAHCHGADARGDEGPDLHALQISDRRIANVIKNGIKGEMPAFAKKHDAAETAELVAYVRSLE